VIIGGGSSLKGVDEIAKQVLRLPTFKYIFDKNNIEFVPDYNNDPSFINCIALAAYSYHHQDQGGTTVKKSNLMSNNVADSAGSAMADLLEKIKKFLPF
jgi:cell division ATPase FtsA